MRGTVEDNGGLVALAGLAPETDTGELVALVGGARVDNLGVLGVGLREVLEELQVVGIGVVRVEPGQVSHATVGLGAGLGGDGDSEILVHGDGVEALGLRVEGGDLVGRDDNVSGTAGRGQTLPGGEAEVGDDLVQLVGIATGADTEDLVAIVVGLLGGTRFGAEGGGVGKAQEGSEDGERLHGGGEDEMFFVAVFLLFIFVVDGTSSIL